MNRTSMTILFVEDDPFVLTMYRSRLQGEGFAVESAVDGLAAIELLPKIRPDAVVLDLMLPKLHGLEVLKFIRADVDLKATPVVVLSNAYMESLATRAIEAGANAGILKTECTPTKLIRILQGLVGKAAATDMASSKGSGRKAPNNKAHVLDARELVVEEACRDSARSELIKKAPEEMASIRRDCLTLVKLGGSPEGLEALNSLYRRVRALSARAGLGGCTKITDLTSSFEAMLFEIVFQFSRSTRSTLQTATQAVDCLARLIQNGDFTPAGPSLPPKVLVVDDDEVCNYATVKALKRANFNAVSEKDPKAALALLEAGPFDLVLLDINMPDLDGFQVCEALRRLPLHKKTPVLFVTINGEFQNRARSILAGGDDLIIKPISPFELMVKVTVRLLRPSDSGTATPIDPEVAQAEVEDRSNGSDRLAANSPRFGKSTNSAPPPLVPAPEPQPLGERLCAPPGLALVQAVPVGVSGFDRSQAGTSAVTLSVLRKSPVVNREFCDGKRLDEQNQILRQAAEDLRSKLSEQENLSAKLRREYEDLKSASSAHVEEMARLHQRLEKARTEREALAGQLTTLKEAHDAAQAVVAQRQQAEERLRRELDEKQSQLQTETQKTLADAGSELESKTQALEAAQATVAKLKDKNVAVERQLQEMNGALAQTRAQLAQEAKLRNAVESQTSELAGLRSTLEQELAQRKQAEEQLRRELDEMQSRLQAKAQTLADQGSKLQSKAQALEAAQATVAKLKSKTQALEAAEATVAELKNKCAAAERQLASAGQTLAQETQRRTSAEDQILELAKSRGSLEQELAQRKQAEAQLQQELIEERIRMQSEVHTLSDERSKLAARTQALATAEATLAKLKDKAAATEQQLGNASEALTQTRTQLTQEAERRAAAERQANELAAVRSTLEQELAQRKQADEQLRRELAEKQSRLQTEVQQTLAEQGSKLKSKAQALETAQATVAKLKDKCAAVELQLESAGQSLAQETERRTAAEAQARDLAKLRSTLEQELAQRKQAEEQLRQKLNEEQTRLQSEVQSLLAERSKLAAAEATAAKLKDKGAATELRLSESLAEEAKRRAAAESQVHELAELRSSLEQELTQRKQAEAQLQHELNEKQIHLQTEVQSLSAERSKLEAKTQALAAAEATVAMLKDKGAATERRLSESLAEEAKRRAVAENQVHELAELRSSLEQELTQRKQAEAQLQHELSEEQTHLQSEVQSLSAERSKLEAKTQALAAAEATVAMLKDKGAATERRLSESLAQEAQRRTAAESQVHELAELRSSLEQELAQRTQTEGQLRHELAEERTRLQTEVQSLSAERSKLAAKTQALAAAEATVATLKDEGATTERRLSESLAQETERLAAAESQAQALAELRSSLEQELAQRTQTEEQLRQELDEKQTRLQTEVRTLSAERSKLEAKAQELEAVTGELSAARSQITQEALEKRRLAARVVEEEHAKAELAKQLAAARERGAAGQMAVQSLESQIQQALAERVKLLSALQAEAAERRRLQLQSENLRATLDGVTSQLKEKTDAEAALSRREIELQDRLQKLQERITESGATLAVQEAELRGTKQKADDLQLIQSALCAQVQQLTATESALVKSRQAVEEELGASQRSIQDGQKALATLRYAMLDGSRVTSRASQGRVQMMQQSAAGLTQVISALLSSPLSPVQRRLASSLQSTLDGWLKDQADNHCSNQLPVAAPVFRSCGFSLGEVAEGAFQAIRQQAAAAGIEVETTQSGNMPGNVVGDADHIGQLIALLPESLLRLPGTRRLGLQLSVEPTVPGPAALNLQLRIAVDGAARETCERLTTIAAASDTLQTAQLGEAESGLAVCWQLAHALGGTVHLDASSDQDVRLQVVLPVEIQSASGVAEPAAAPRPAAAVCEN